MLSRLALSAGLFALMLHAVPAQRSLPSGDPPSAHSLLPDDQTEAPDSTALRIFQAVSWYIPNRIADIADIPRLYFTLGDGLGISLRATRLMSATYYESDTYALGWQPRNPPIFSEKVQEQYLGFLGAQAGETDRDFSEVGISLHLAIIGINLAGSAGQLADAVLGIVGVDLANDDHGPMLIEAGDQTAKDSDDAYEGGQPGGRVGDTQDATEAEPELAVTPLPVEQ